MMILFAILLIIVLLCVAVIVLGAGTFGATFILLFGDVIVCIAIIIWLMKKLFKRNK